MGLPLALLVAVGLALSSPGAAELQREGRTQNHGHSVCSTWGDFHYKTFDGDVFRFPGLCDYNFASDCRGSYKEFAVHLKRVSSRDGGRPGLEYILLTIKDDTIYLTRQLVVVNGAMVSMPHYSSGLLIEKNHAYTKVYSRAGLTLMWNREDSLMLELDSKFRNHTCGLCGDYNGLQTYSEFLSDGVLFSAIEFGNLQKVHKPEVVCEDPEEEPAPESCSQHRAECEELLAAAAFEDCEGLVPRQPFVQACVQDRCHCPDGPSCACSTLAEFSRQCSHAGGRPGNWRTAEFCPKSCPGNMVYLESGSPCVDTCSHLESSRLCEEHRMDGCFCPEGTVYDDIAGSGCVPVSRCHCRLHGRLYSPGQQLSSDCEECVCTAGRWVCRDLPCPGTCALEGGSHITTFDGKRYTFHGDCYYVLIKGDHNDSYALLGELAPCGSTDKQTCLKTVVLLADNRKNVVAFQSDGGVLLNERPVSLPHATASLSVFRPSSRHLMVSTAVGLRLQVQLEPVMQLFVTLDRAAQGRVQGLCGNFNGLEGDDFRTAGGLVEATGAGFANTWKAQASCHDKLDWLDDPCSLNIESANYAEHWCSLLKKTETPFGRCHSAVDPSDYYKRCKYDACNCQNSEGCMCAALSSYARACAAKGVLLWGWREQVCNEDVGSCPSSQVFLYNLTTCQPTCRSLSEADAHCPQGFAPVDGCGCPDNTFLDEKGRCVPLAKCSCYHHGLYLEAGEVVLRQEERCVCQNGRLHCRPVRLLGQSCSAPKIYVDCSNLTALTVQSSRPTSCQTRAAGHYQTECVSGCVCPDGLMDDGRGGCVKEAECPCVHNKDLYSPGDEIKVDCNTCTCRRGRWACTESPCHGSCSIYGSGHYVTFDGKYYDFDGHCSYVAVQDYCGQNSSSGSFSVMTENVPCGTTGVTCSKAIKIFLGRTELKLEDKHRLVIQRDTGHHVAYTTREVGQYLVVEASIGVIVIWDKKTTVFIKLAPSYKGRVCGLCGNFDQRSSNDFTTRDHMVVDSELDFGNSWKEAPTCPDVSVTPDPCARNPHRLSWAEKQCSIIKSSVFSVCHSKVDPKPFYEACVHDSCSCDTGGDCECFCSAVASYAQECTKEGACVFWRTPDLCPVFCDYYNPPDECEWHYEPCGNRSFETCRTVNGIHSNISVSYLEGCYPRCPEDRPVYDEDLKRCVTADQCGCYVGDTRYPPGAPVPSEEDCQSCVCTNTSKVCQPEEGKILNYTQDGFFCYWEICGPNGTVERHFNICVSTTSRPPSTTIPVTSSTALTTTTTTPTPTPSPTPRTCCFWSDWVNENHPSVHSGSGDWETFDSVCRAPEDIECRLAVEPHLSWEQAGQNAQCNVTFGFICYNEDQFGNGPFEVCYDYEIRVNCCVPMDQCPPSTTTATTTTTTSTPTPEPPTTTTTTTTATPTPTPTTTPTTTTTGTEPPTISTTGPKTTTPSPSTTTTTTVTPTSTPTISTTTGTKTTTPTPTTTTTTPTTTTTGTESPTTSTTTPTQGLSTTEPTIAPCVPQCNWTGWVDSGKPNPSRPGGDIESIQGLCKEGWAANISCRAVMFPQIPIEELGQKLVCDLSVGLVCKNEDQKPGGTTPPICFNYEINVECCVLPEYCISTLPPASTPTLTPTTTTTTGTPTTTPPTTTTTGTPTPTMTTGTATTTPIITTTTGIPTSTPTISTSTGTKTTTPTPATTTTTTMTPTSTPTISTTTGTETTTPTPTTTMTVTPTSTPTISTTTGTETTTPTSTTTTTTTVTPTSTPTISTTTGTKTTTPTPATTTTTVTPTSTPTISTTTGTETTTPTMTNTTTTTETPTSTPTISTTTGTKTTTPTPATTTTTVTATSTPTISTTTGTKTTTPTPATTTTTVTPSSTPTISTTMGTETTTPTPTTTTTTTETPTSTPTISTTTGTKTTTPTPATTTTTVTPTSTPTISTTTGTETTTPTPTTTMTVTPTSTPTISTTTGTEITTPTPTTTMTATPTSTPTISTTTGSEITTPTRATTTTVTPTSTPTISTTTGTEITTPTPTTTTTTPTTTTTGTESPTTSTTTTTTSYVPTPTLTPISTPNVGVSTGPVRSSTQVRCCVLNETYFAPGETVYNGTHGDTCYYANCSLACTIEIFNWSCPSTPSPAPTPSKPTPISTPKPPTPTASSTVATTKPPGCPDFDPPRQENEKWWLCNCTMAICKYNNTVELVEVECEVPPEPTCANGLRPTLVYSPEECCPHWECDCYCAGWGDPHYVTFDGLYYSYQGNCTYVLVEEITPTLGNFGVYIDNYHCDANDRVSCPRTLVVRYQSQEVLVKTLQMMPIKVQVQVNRQVVALPYMKNELHVYQSGISYVVEISKLGALITYNGLSFSITLPHRLFGNNTKGQCGTCTNDTADDCMLPSGEVVSDCELAADQWVVNDPSKPHCPHTSVTTKRPAVTPPGASTTSGKDCASPLCELIRDSLFAPCHAVVPPKHYYEACVFDSCFVPGSGLECASLQAYAALCAQANICVDWRNHTHGVCSMTCPPHREYRACGPADEPSCESGTAALRPIAQKNARLVEGCFCPEGTMNYAPGFDVCVEMCGCVGPDDVPRKFGEHFEFDCKDCVCLEGGRGIICEPKECRQEPVTCPEDGTYPLTEVNPADTCCNITSCKCNTSLCQGKPPKCPLGFDVSSETKPGKCCPSYSCVPKGVCVHANAEYQPGSPVYSSKCEDCVCTNRTDGGSRLNIISCTHVHCEDSCSPGFELVDVPGQCCGKCQQTHCIIKRPGTETIILKPGDIRHDPNNNCTFFSCANIHNQLISSVSNITCPDFDPSICLPGSVTLMPNGCCRKCTPRNETRIFCSTVPMTKEISHSGCTKKVVMNSCSGSCGTSVKYSAEAQALDHQCSCCKEGRTSQREVELSCPDGSSRKHRYTHIESCSCQDTVCGLPRAQRRAPGRERRASPRGLPLGRD
ncbi:mucin-2 [Mustela erminea]|uniref:mucin-2 n=1 Tax=Mustela erminea TaxID=36723 RepID=UPI00138742FB|nr:mucin-2 [Mustela erminea]